MLRRYRMPLLSHLDQATGLPARRPPSRNATRCRPGDLVHVDIKKLGRIPDGGGHRKLGRTVGNRNNKRRGRGYAYLHHAVDDHSRLVYSEILADERKDTAAGFWDRGPSFFPDAGFVVIRVLTDNGSCYRSNVFKNALGTGVKHRRTRPVPAPDQWQSRAIQPHPGRRVGLRDTYRSDEARAATYDNWLHHYNHHRAHTGIGGLIPSSLRVHNLTGNYS